MSFKPIATNPVPAWPKMFVAVAVLDGYTTDPWCVWYQQENPTPENKCGFVRWPHPFPPTHWMEIPEPPEFVRP